MCIRDRHYDDTVCNTCKNDFGDEVLKMNSHYPICDSCIVLLREKIFPKWVKAFFAVLVLIILFSFFWNLKYYQAYKEYNQANEFYSHGDFTNASKLALSANSKVQMCIRDRSNPDHSGDIVWWVV